MRRLILFRHAKADTPDGIADSERPLAVRGRADAALIGAYLAGHGLRPDAALVSPARRTRETWEFAATALGAAPPVSFEERLYDARAETLLEVLQGAPAAARSLMVIAHNPGIEELARALADDHRLAHKFPTAGLAVIDFPVEDWSELRPGAGRLVQYVSPKTVAGKK